MLPDLRAKREECALQMNELAGHSSSAGRDAEPAQAVIRGPPADAGGASADACAGVGGAARAECIKAVCQPKDPPGPDCPGGGAARLRVAAARAAAAVAMRGRCVEAERRAALLRTELEHEEGRMITRESDDAGARFLVLKDRPGKTAPVELLTALRAAAVADREWKEVREQLRLAPRARAVQSSARGGAAGAQGQLGADGALA